MHASSADNERNVEAPTTKAADTYGCVAAWIETLSREGLCEAS